MISLLIENMYKENGISDYVLKNIDDIRRIHGIDILMTNGYADLTEENKELYQRFIINFYNGYGLEARATLIPLSINYVEEIDYLGKKNPEDDYYVLLSQEVQIIKADGTRKILKKSKDDTYRSLESYKVERREYLRFEYEIYGEKTWQHVTSPTEWY